MACLTKLYLYQYLDVIKDTFEAGKTFRLDIVGDSMSPTLVEGDAVVLDKPLSIKKKDIILYRTGAETFALHRVVAVDDIITARGDNNIANERVERSDIIAKVVSIEKKDSRAIRVGTLAYNNKYVYSVVRRFFRRVRNRLAR